MNSCKWIGLPEIFVASGWFRVKNADITEIFTCIYGDSVYWVLSFLLFLLSNLPAPWFFCSQNVHFFRFSKFPILFLLSSFGGLFDYWPLLFAHNAGVCRERRHQFLPLIHKAACLLTKDFGVPRTFRWLVIRISELPADIIFKLLRDAYTADNVKVLDTIAIVFHQVFHVVSLLSLRELHYCHFFFYFVWLFLCPVYITGKICWSQSKYYTRFPNSVFWFVHLKEIKLFISHDKLSLRSMLGP